MTKKIENFFTKIIPYRPLCFKPPLYGIFLYEINFRLSSFGKSPYNRILFLYCHPCNHIKNNDSEYAALINRETGYYLLILGAIVILGAGIYGIISNRKKKN